MQARCDPSSTRLGARSVEVWRNVRTYQQLQVAMQLFLTGKLNHSPWHGQYVMRETRPQIDSLCRMNAAGFVTNCSQPGLSTSLLRQRAFVDGFIHRHKWPMFTNILLASEKVWVVTHHPENCDTVHGTQLPNTDAILVTHMIAPNVYPTSVPYRASFHEGQFMHRYNSDMAQYLCQHTCHVSIVWKQWGETGLEDFILRALNDMK